jgi:hypothetical protein
MKIIISAAIAAALAVTLSAQDQKPVPKDSVRVSVPGCSKDYIFTAGRRAEDQGGAGVPEGMHLRMNGPKKLIAEIRAREGSRVEITGLIRKGQYGESGVSIGRGVRVGPGSSGPGGTMSPGIGSGPVMIDIEGWRSIAGDDCPGH